jgi:hypothetical protein
VAGDLRSPYRIGRVHVDPRLEVTGGDARRHVLDLQHGRHRHLEAGRDALARFLGLRPLAGRGELGAQWRSDASLPVAVEEAAHLELAEGDEPHHLVAGPQEHLVVDADLYLAERQRPRARLDHDGRFLLAALERLGEAEIVEVGRQSKARVDRGDRCLLRPAEHEGIGVDGGGEEVLGLLAPHRVIEGQLGQDEEVLAAQFFPGPPERGQDDLRVFVEALREPEACQQLLGIRAGMVGREHVRGDRAVHRLRVHVRDPDRRGAGAGRQQDDR